MRTANLLLTCLALSSLASGQTLTLKHVTITGDSIARMQGGFQQFEFPLLPPSNVTIFGMDSYTCAHLLPLIPYLVPARTDIAVLYEATNDIATGVAPADHVTCMEKTIAVLQNRNPKIQIILANEHPWTQDNCDGDFRDRIDAFNAAYASTPWPANVQVVDVWTPNADPTTHWAIAQDMTGACGIHPGPANQWTWSWQHFTSPVTQAVTSAILHGYE